MSDASTVIAFLALAMAGIAVFVSLLARRDSNRSARAAEKAAQESEKTRRISQIEILLPKFNAAEHLFHVIAHKSNQREHLAPQEQAVKAASELIEILKTDNEATHILNRMIQMEANAPIRTNSSILYGQGNQLPADLPSIRNMFSETRQKYLSIG